MSKWMFALLAVLLVTLSGCASSGGSASAPADNSGLPEIMPYDEAPVDPLPDMVPAEV